MGQGTDIGALWIAVLCLLATSSATRVALFAQNFGEFAGSRWYTSLALPLGVLFDLMAVSWAFFPFSLFTDCHASAQARTLRLVPGGFGLSIGFDFCAVVPQCG